MSIARFSIKHKVSVLLTVILIGIFGVTFTTQLQTTLMPDLELPMAVVVCYYNGANPDDMEQLITRPLETAIMSVNSKRHRTLIVSMTWSHYGDREIFFTINFHQIIFTSYFISRLFPIWID